MYPTKTTLYKSFFFFFGRNGKPYKGLGGSIQRPHEPWSTILVEFIKGLNLELELVKLRILL